MTKTVTSTIPSCTSISSSRKSDVTLTQSCSCPSTLLSPSNSETVQKLKATSSNDETLLKPFGLLFGKKGPLLQQRNNSVPRSCSPQTQIGKFCKLCWFLPSQYELLDRQFKYYFNPSLLFAFCKKLNRR